MQMTTPLQHIPHRERGCQGLESTSLSPVNFGQGAQGLPAIRWSVGKTLLAGLAVSGAGTCSTSTSTCESHLLFADSGCSLLLHACCNCA